MRLYQRSAGKRAPEIVADLLEIRLSNHSSIAVQELMHTVGILDPNHRSTSAAVQQIQRVIKGMRSYRIFVPDMDVLGRAAFFRHALPTAGLSTGRAAAGVA